MYSGWNFAHIPSASALSFFDEKAEYIMSTWLSRRYIRLWFCVKFAVSELPSSPCNQLLLLFSSERSVTKINTIFIAIMNVTHSLFVGWPQASIICLRPICKYWCVLQIICSHFIWDLKVLQFCSLRSVWSQRYSYKSKDLPVDTIDSQGCQVMKMRCFRFFVSFLRRIVLRKLQLNESTALELQQTLFTLSGGKKWSLHMQMYGIWKCHIATSTYK